MNEEILELRRQIARLTAMQTATFTLLGGVLRAVLPNEADYQAAMHTVGVQLEANTENLLREIG